MAEGWSVAAANTALDTLLAAYPWMKLHTGAPGAAGASNAAGNTVRKQVVFTSAASATTSNSGTVSWTSVSTSEDYTHASWWSLESGGSFGFSGSVTANPVIAGDNFQFGTGEIDITQVTAS